MINLKLLTDIGEIDLLQPGDVTLVNHGGYNLPMVYIEKGEDGVIEFVRRGPRGESTRGNSHDFILPAFVDRNSASLSSHRAVQDLESQISQNPSGIDYLPKHEGYDHRQKLMKGAGLWQ